MNSHAPLTVCAAPAPTAARPFMGLTILVVEDSRYASEAVRLLCLRSGARIRRADSLTAARRHLGVYRPAVLIVDLGLPDGDGAALIRSVAHAQPRIPAILAMSGDPGRPEEAAAAGADSFLAKPLDSLVTFQQAVLAQLPPERRPVRLIEAQPEDVRPGGDAYHDDMAHAAALIENETGDAALDYLVQFLGGVARSAADAPLADATDALAAARREGRAARADLARIAGMVQERLAG